MDSPNVDYNVEARKLFAVLGLDSDGASTGRTSSQYNDLDPVFKHPQTGAQVFIGNQTASRDRGILERAGVTHIVNCTDDMANAFEGRDASIHYFRFDIYKYFSELDLSTHDGVVEFFAAVFKWIDNAVSSGNSVMIHCLAGAHRAGTTGCAYVMHAAELDHRTAIAACQQCRPVVNPMGDLTGLLAQLGVGQRLARHK